MKISGIRAKKFKNSKGSPVARINGSGALRLMSAIALSDLEAFIRWLQEILEARKA